MYFVGYIISSNRLRNPKRSFHGHVRYVNAEQWSAKYARQLLGLFSLAGSLNNDLQATQAIGLVRARTQNTSSQVLSDGYKQYHLSHSRTQKSSPDTIILILLQVVFSFPLSRISHPPQKKASTKGIISPRNWIQI